MTLRPGAFVRGRVLGVSAEPLASAAVRFCPVEDRPLCVTEDSATSGVGGTFVLGPLPPGWYEIRARVPGLVDENLNRDYGGKTLATFQAAVVDRFSTQGIAFGSALG